MAVAVFCGFLTILFYDIYWLLSAYKRRPHLLRTIQDLLFWSATFCIVAALWLYATGGVLRLAVYLWMAGGGLLCRTTCSRWLRRLRRRPMSTISLAAEVPKKPGSSVLPSRPPYLLAAPTSAMFGLGLGFWRGLAWLGAVGKGGGAWLKARLPQRFRSEKQQSQIENEPGAIPKRPRQ